MSSFAVKKKKLILIIINSSRSVPSVVYSRGPSPDACSTMIIIIIIFIVFVRTAIVKNVIINRQFAVQRKIVNGIVVFRLRTARKAILCDFFFSICERGFISEAVRRVACGRKDVFSWRTERSPIRCRKTAGKNV